MATASVPVQLFTAEIACKNPVIFTARLPTASKTAAETPTVGQTPMLQQRAALQRAPHFAMRLSQECGYRPSVGERNLSSSKTHKQSVSQDRNRSNDVVCELCSGPMCNPFCPVTRIAGDRHRFRESAGQSRRFDPKALQQNRCRRIRSQQTVTAITTAAALSAAAISAAIVQKWNHHLLPPPAILVNQPQIHPMQRHTWPKTGQGFARQTPTHRSFWQPLRTQQRQQTSTHQQHCQKSQHVQLKEVNSRHGKCNSTLAIDA